MERETSIETNVLAEGALAVLRFSGHLTTQQALAGFAQLRGQAGYDRCAPELLDLSNVAKFGMRYQDMERLAKETNRMSCACHNHKKIAVLAPKQLTFGMARMFCTLMEIAPGTAQACAFKTKEETLSWLDVPLTDLGQ